jgi:hypothetical protein
MDLQNLINIIKLENKIVIDYTKKIKSIEDFIEFNNYKVTDKKYKNVVFIIQIHYVSIMVQYFLIYKKMVPHDIDNSFVMLLNGDGRMLFNTALINKSSNVTIRNFINNQTIMTLCNICCNDATYISTCGKCSYSFCIDCHKKIISCPVCNEIMGKILNI